MVNGMQMEPNEKEEECKSGKKDKSTKGGGLMIKDLGKEDAYFRMAMSTQVNGKMISVMDKVLT